MARGGQFTDGEVKAAFEDLDAHILPHLESLCAELFPAGHKHGHEYEVGDIHGNPGKSFKVNLDSGVFKDFGSGDAAGSGSIALYAKHHGMKMREAAIELARKFAFDHAFFEGDIDKQRQRERKQKSKPKTNGKQRPTTIKYEDRDWNWLIPPFGVDRPATDNTMYEYMTPDGQTLLYVERTPNKQFYPWIWAETVDGQQRKWIPKHPLSGTRPLYNLHLITQRESKPVLIVEGEKAADAAQDKLNMPVTTSMAGSSGGPHADWSPLKGRRVIIWPDADEPGLKHQEKVAKILHDLGCKIWVINTDGFALGYDAADVVAEGLSLPPLMKERQERWRPPGQRPEKPKPMEAPPHGPDDVIDAIHNANAPAEDDPSRNRLEWWEPRILGTVDNHIAAIPYNGSNIELMQSRKLTKGDLLNLARKDMYWSVTHAGPPRNDGQDPEPNWDAAINDLQDAARAMKEFEPHNVRRRGVWREPDGTLLFNSGDALYDVSAYEYGAPRDPIPLSKHRGYYAYIGGPDLAEFVAPPGEGLSGQEATRLVDILKEVSWVRPQSVYLLAGWLFAAPLCGLLDWRSHIWITGPHGSGKTTLLQQVIIPLLNNMCRAFEGGSTGAGVRQDLRSDGLAVIYDEAESEKAKHRSNFKSTMEQILDLARVASSSSGGRVVKGTGTQTGALSYFLHSMFCFSSIVIDIENAADDSRVTRLEIVKNTRPDAEDQFQNLREMIHNTINEKYCARFLRRCMDEAPWIRKNAEVFSEILARMLADRRSADQLATLIAGYYGLVRGGVVSRKAAKEFCEAMPWHEVVSHETAADDDAALWTILDYKIRVDLHVGTKTFAVRELLSMAGGEMLDPDIGYKLAQDTLRSWDIRYVSKVEAQHEGGIPAEGFLIDPVGAAASTALRDTRYANAARNLLVRKGALSWKPTKVARGSVAKTVRPLFVSMALVTGETEDETYPE